LIFLYHATHRATSYVHASYATHTLHTGVPCFLMIILSPPLPAVRSAWLPLSAIYSSSIHIQDIKEVFHSSLCAPSNTLTHTTTSTIKQPCSPPAAELHLPLKASHAPLPTSVSEKVDRVESPDDRRRRVGRWARMPKKPMCMSRIPIHTMIPLPWREMGIQYQFPQHKNKHTSFPSTWRRGKGGTRGREKEP